MASELTDEQILNMVERAELDAEVVAIPHPYRVASMLGRELLAASARIADIKRERDEAWSELKVRKDRIATLSRDLAEARAKLGQASRRVWLVVDDDNDGQLAAFDEVVVYLDEKVALARCAELNADDPGRYRAEWAHLDANPYAPAGEKEGR